MLVHRLVLRPEVFSKVPPAERALLHVMGHALNEINVLLKLFFLVSNHESEPQVVRHAQLCQAMVLSRLLTGKLYEAWQSIQKGYFRKKLGTIYAGELDKETTDGLENLKRYFGKTNLIDTVRNSFAFHYSLAHAEEAPNSDVEPEELAMYFGPTTGTSLYQFAEHAMGLAMLKSVNTEDPQEAFNRIAHETQQVVSWFNSFAQGILFAVLERHAGLTKRVPELESIDLGPVPRAIHVVIPFFFEIGSTDESDGESHSNC